MADQEGDPPIEGEGDDMSSMGEASEGEGEDVGQPSATSIKQPDLPSATSIKQPDPPSATSIKQPDPPAKPDPSQASAEAAPSLQASAEQAEAPPQPPQASEQASAQLSLASVQPSEQPSETAVEPSADTDTKSKTQPEEGQSSLSIHESATQMSLPGEAEEDNEVSEVPSETLRRYSGGGAIEQEGELLVEEPEEERYIEPLGQATEEFLAEQDMKPWILGKMYHLGNMGRFGLIGSDSAKPEQGGIEMFDVHQWQLEKMYREVPQDMSLGKVRSKPDDLVYEEERFILGKMYRDLNEMDYGYMPTAFKEESALDLSCDPVEVTVFPTEPQPCFMPSMEVIMDDNDKGCLAQAEVIGPSGKVFKFSYGGDMAVSVASMELNQQQQQQPNVVSVPSGRVSMLIPQATETCASLRSASKRDPSFPVMPSSLMQSTVLEASSGPGTVMASSIPGSVPANNGGDGGCSDLSSAARRAMAIYDVVTGCDNFPCNACDKPENSGDEMWPWLYDLILKFTPVDENRNELGVTKPGAAGEEQPEGNASADPRK